MEQIKRIDSIYLFYLVFFLFMINRLFFFSPGVAEQTVSCLLYPFLKIQSVLLYPFTSSLSQMRYVSTMQNKIDELVEQNQTLQAKLIEHLAAANFSEQTEELIRFSRRYAVDKKKLVKVLLSVFSDKEDVFIIEGGANEKIQKDDVVVYQNMLIGRVIEVYQWYSKVALITDRRCKISAQCKEGVEGVFSGKNNNRVELNFIPHFKKIELGEMILSTGNGLVYPQGFGLGQVVSIKTDNVSHSVEAKTLVDLSTVSYVYIFSKT